MKTQKIISIKSLLNKILSTLILCLLTSTASAYIQAYGFMNWGDSSMDENSGGNYYTHRSSFFIGHWGAGLGLKFVVPISNFGIGILGEGAWLGDTMERKQNGVTFTDSNRFESYRLLYGGTFIFNFGVVSLLLEYIPSAQNTTTYSNGGNYNFFRQGDKFTGSGYGIGLTFGASKEHSFLINYRNLVYKDIQSAGTPITLPTSTYSELKFEDVLIGGIVTF